MRRSLLLAAFAALFLVCAPARAQFCPGVSPWVFDDVAASDPFCGYITWMAENGISLGCQIIDPNHRLYCPNDNVTRKQMAAFMNRLGDARVEAVDTGPGLTGGPITGIGTINLATTQLLPTTACASGQMPVWNGTAWACGTPNAGTVTSVATGAGLTGGPITGSGTIAADTSYLQRRVSQTCTVGSAITAIAADGTVTCAPLGAGTVTSVATGTGLTGGPITGAGTVSIAPGGVGTTELANFAVTKTRINANGGTAGKVLATDGTNLSWEQVPTVYRWHGLIGSIPSTGAWVFVGPTTQIVLLADRRITASVSAGLGVLSGSGIAINTNVCYQSTAGPGPIQEFTPNSMIVVSILTAVLSYAADGSVLLPAGSYNVGFCALNGTGVAIDFTTAVRGWAMVTLN